MIRFDGVIVQFGFGAVGRSFYEIISQEIKFNENKYFVITNNAYEFDAYINLGGMAANFITHEITKENFSTVFQHYLNKGDLLIDFADAVGTKDICDWCAEENIMYINTGDADWPMNWLNIFEQHQSFVAIKEKHYNNHLTNQYPIVLQHGNNPGLVSHFVKAGIEYIIKNQYKKDKRLKTLIKQNKFNEAAYLLGIKTIHVNDNDLQEINADYDERTLINTWCIDSFLFEMLTEAAMIIGSHEDMPCKDTCKFVDTAHGYVELNKLSAEIKCRTYYPGGGFEGFLVPHDEIISIAKSLEVKLDVPESPASKPGSAKQNLLSGEVIYRPTVMFLYAPCHTAAQYLYDAKVNEYPNPDPAKPLDCESENGQTIIRGYKYPENAEIVYKEKIAAGTEYVGVLLMGENFDPVWVGNRVDLSFLYKKEKNAYWQTPTITPVAMSALAAVCWMIKNKDKGGIYFPDDITDYQYILKIAEKYISKTIYKTFDKETVKDALNQPPPPQPPRPPRPYLP